jgi:hypothetical protein
MVKTIEKRFPALFSVPVMVSLLDSFLHAGSYHGSHQDDQRYGNNPGENVSCLFLRPLKYIFLIIAFIAMKQ